MQGGRGDLLQRADHILICRECNIDVGGGERRELQGGRGDILHRVDHIPSCRECNIDVGGKGENRNWQRRHIT